VFGSRGLWPLLVRFVTRALRRPLHSAHLCLEVGACGRSWALRYVAASSATPLRALVFGSRGLWPL